jgi:hypothetical protein
MGPPQQTFLTVANALVTALTDRAVTVACLLIMLAGWVMFLRFPLIPLLRFLAG